MGICIMKNKNGGLGNPLFGCKAMILLQYIEKVKVTCEKDGIILNATPGLEGYCFALPEAGTWTLHISRGTRSRAQDITVEEGDSIFFVFILGEELFLNKDFPEFTGGWSRGADRYDDLLGIYAHGYGLNGTNYVVETNNYIKMTEYNYLHYDVFALAGADKRYPFKVELVDEWGDVEASAELTEGEHLLDLRFVPNKCKVRFSFRGAAASDWNVYIQHKMLLNNVWLQ